ncbi:rhomboid family intramembrane serine protease [Natronosalvus vescus]|uniref:rhomboid family intramembrane serine protease n=1 Tax=Natronosalvus vescus TaxID=2953881 RepID=UPI002090CBB2|nr:rhomboid family intramembrane serine protease [Natronosalvus vescus]
MSSDPGTGSPILETLALFTIVFVLQAITSLFSMAMMAGLFVLEVPIENQPWTIVTSVYAHAGVGHLLSNSIGLVLFGWPIARATTRVRFHTFFITMGAIAGVSQVVITSALASLAGSGGAAGVLGASGAVFALMGYLLAGNRLSDGLASRIQVPLWMTLVVFLVLAGATTILTAAPQVALIAHFTGFFLGLVAGRAGLLEVSRTRQPTGRAA